MKTCKIVVVDWYRLFHLLDLYLTVLFYFYFIFQAPGPPLTVERAVPSKNC